jgi:purine nucleoside phosphorylase
VLQNGPVSTAVGDQVRAICTAAATPVAAEVVFGYVGGPRTKTAAENRLCARLGMQVNSMTLGPELVLAGELEIPCAALVVGHKYSLGDPSPRPEATLDEAALAETLVRSRQELEQIVLTFLRRARPVPFENQIFRFAGR